MPLLAQSVQILHSSNGCARIIGNLCNARGNQFIELGLSGNGVIDEAEAFGLVAFHHSPGKRKLSSFTNPYGLGQCL